MAKKASFRKHKDTIFPMHDFPLKMIYFDDIPKAFFL